MRPTAHPAREAGITLLEVMVAIVVIGMLAALTLPVLTRVRDRAKEAVCLNNFRQLGVGLKLYQADHRDSHPLATTERGTRGGAVPRGMPGEEVWNLHGALGGKDVNEAPPWLPPAHARPLNRYVPDPRSFLCPADGGIDFRGNGGPHWRSLWESFGCSYTYNAYGTPSDAVDRTRIGGKGDRWISQPSRFIVVHEPPARRQSWGTQGFYVYWHRSHPTKTIQSNRNLVADGRLISPILFADGHAEIMDFTDEGGSGLNSDRWIWYRPE